MKEYNNIAKIPSSLLDVGIEEYYPAITEDDIAQGFKVRYFTRQTNHKTGDITEIDEQTYIQLQSNSLYRTVSLEWKIAGPLDDVPGMPHINSPTRLRTGVITANKLSLAEAEKDMPGLKYKLMNSTQFWVGK